MSDEAKRTTDAAPASATMRVKLKLPKNSKDVTAETIGTMIGIVGARPKLPAPSDVRREKLLQAVLENNPKLTREQAIEMLKDAGL
jgi:hypothetical protein